MFGGLGFTELFFIFVLALIIFGPRKLPELGKTIGEALGQFKRASEDFKRSWEEEVDLEKRKALWKQIQQQWASNVTDMGGIIPGLARTISLAWPYFGNYAAIAPWTPPTTTNPIEAFAYYWYDESKKA